MIHYIVIDTNRFASPELYDSRTNRLQKVQFDGARSFLQQYINKLKLYPISIHETHLPEKTQLVCWYTIKEPLHEIGTEEEWYAQRNQESLPPIESDSSSRSWGS